MQQHRFNVAVESNPDVFDSNGRLPERVLQDEIASHLESLTDVRCFVGPTNQPSPDVPDTSEPTTEPHTETSFANRPASTIRSGSIKVDSWKQSGRHGELETASITRSWKDDAVQRHDQKITNLSAHDLLSLSVTPPACVTRSSKGSRITRRDSLARPVGSPRPS